VGIGDVRGAVDSQLASPPGTPQLMIRLRPQRLLQFGFQPINLLDAIQTAYQRATAGQIYEGNRVFDVSVILPPELRENPEATGSLLVQNAEGTRVPLNRLADIYETNGRYSVAHYGTRRVQEVLCNVRGRDLTSFVKKAEQAVHQKVNFSGGVYTVFAGASETRKRAQHDLMVYSLVAGAGILLLLSIAFHNLRNTALVLANLPFALIGGVLAAFLTGANLSVGSMVGFVELFGITTRNSIIDDLPFRASGHKGRRTVGPARGNTRCDGAIQSRVDDRHRDSAWAAALSTGKRRAWEGNRRPYGHCDSGRLGNLNSAEPSRASNAGSALRPIRTQRVGGMSCTVNRVQSIRTSVSADRLAHRRAKRRDAGETN
jgi:hypothetical protein